MNVYAISKLGLVRKNNEDCYLIDNRVFYEESYKALNKKHRTFAVFDGLGGRNAGEVASFESAKFLASYFAKKAIDYQEMVIEINEKLIELSKTTEEYEGMGTTIAGITIENDVVHVYNMGDSLIFRIRDKQIEELTVEHSLALKMLAEGESLEYANQFRHKMTKCLGKIGMTKADVSYNKINEGIKANDIFILTTDGITDLVDRNKILEIFLTNPVEVAMKELEANVLEKGARDNFTMIVIEN